MNFTDTFQDFSSKLSTSDLALYAGVGLVLWVLFRERLSPVQQLVMDLVNKLKGVANLPKVPTPVSVATKEPTNDNFFDLVVSWKQTRDLAVKSGCSEAVKVADQMFPFLSPTVCANKQENLK